MVFINIASVGAFFSAYSQADFFGKLIFWGLFSLSIISWIVLLHKIWYTRRLKFLSNKFKKHFNQRQENILDINIDYTKYHPFLEIYNTVKQKTLEILKKNKYFLNKEENIYLSQSDIELVESHLSACIADLSKHLEKNLFILSTIVTLAPFLGLLGTVWGILITFSNLQTNSLATGNSSILSGLSMALATTVIGLVVAIPALIAYNYLKHALKDFRKDTEIFSHHLLTTLELQYKKVDIE
jgi:biopolymer transport protein TolQ